MVKKKALSLPPAGASMAKAVRRLEQISRAIQKSVQKKRRVAANADRSPLDAYRHFRKKAFKLLDHYVENEMEAAFRFLAEMQGKGPKRSRGRVRGNDFHIGLLAMTAAAGDFMSRNRLRELAMLMQQARAEGIKDAEFNQFVARSRNRSEHDD